MKSFVIIALLMIPVFKAPWIEVGPSQWVKVLDSIIYPSDGRPNCVAFFTYIDHFNLVHNHAAMIQGKTCPYEDI